MIKLFIIYGMDKGQSFELDSDTVYLGRSSKNDIQIKDSAISRKHLKIIKKSDTYFLEDLKSTNGTFINNKPIFSGREVKIEEGTPFAIGKVLFSLGKEYPGKVSDIQDWVEFSGDLIQTGKVLVKDRSITLKKNLELIYKVNDIFKQSLDINELLEQFLNYILGYFKTIDRGVIILFNHETGKVSKVIDRSKKSSDDTVEMYSRTIVNRVVQEGTAIMMSDTSREDEANLSESMKLMQIKSVMCVPLISRSQIRGVIYIDSINKPYGFNKEDLFLLNALSSPAALAIESATLYSKLEK